MLTVGKAGVILLLPIRSLVMYVAILTVGS